MGGGGAQLDPGPVAGVVGQVPEEATGPAPHVEHPTPSGRRASTLASRTGFSASRYSAAFSS